MVHFYQAPIGKKAIMAVTGVILFGYVLGHMLGNLQIFAPDHDQINRYAAFLHSPGNFIPLWLIRAVLFVAVILHIVAAFQLNALNHEARPVAYVKKKDASASYASRTMMWSGPIVAAFVIFHVLHLTVGSVTQLHEFAPEQPDVRYNLVSSFQNPLLAVSYIIAIVLLCLHLNHGLWSMFQSLGATNPRSTPAIKRGAALFAALIAVGFISVPLAILSGMVTY